ncbi:hypothetical protein LCM10_09380 [Rossellomorea aquimaris]|uniref:hypothetical protein n=1 Tax=Rossellomorea aquimaris TaxID=189382 RepID=UPI001CD430C1|nr:hypothetical protein [Rossellomorea aquimaris]MCA1055198.1 hypothetical protein [Rossellomorea aquimaris]
MGMKSNEAKRVLKELDPKVMDVADTYISCELGISLFITYNRVETVLVFERGYYDEIFELLAEMDDD